MKEEERKGPRRPSYIQTIMVGLEQTAPVERSVRGDRGWTLWRWIEGGMAVRRSVRDDRD